MILFRKKKTIYDVIAGHRKEIDRGLDSALKELEQVWRRAEPVIDSKFRAYRDKLPSNSLRSPGQNYRTQQFDDLINVIRIQTQALAAKGLTVTKNGQEQMVAMTGRHLQDLIPKGSAAQPDIRALRAIIGSMGDGSPLVDRFAKIGTRAADSARQILAQGIIEGKNPREVGFDLKRELRFTHKRSADLIARTEIIRSYRVATHERYNANSDILEGWQWLSALDGRTCPICLGLHGQKFGLDKQMNSHPDCRCTQVPFLADYPAIINQSGDEWLRSQPESVQRAVIPSPERFAMWQSGKKLEDFVADVDRGVWGQVPSLIPLKAIRDDSMLQKWRNRPSPKSITEKLTDRVASIAQQVKQRPSMTLNPVGLKNKSKAVLSITNDILDSSMNVAGAKSTKYIDSRSTSAQGSFNFSQNTIYVNPNGQNPIATAVHEYGHKISVEIIGQGVSAASNAKEFAKWRAAVVKSDAFKALLKADQNNGIVEVGKSRITLDKNFLNYLTSWEELWARSFTQWTLSRSRAESSNLILDVLLQTPEEMLTASHWHTDDFEPIAKEIDKLMVKLKWKLKNRATK